MSFQISSSNPKTYSLGLKETSILPLYDHYKKYSPKRPAQFHRFDLSWNMIKPSCSSRPRQTQAKLLVSSPFSGHAVASGFGTERAGLQQFDFPNIRIQYL
jgi:hypothetical protein